MKFKDVISSYLEGNIFSNNLEIKISKSEDEIISRFKFIEEICKNKKIIHLGCCDHIPLIESKIQNNTWLHQRIYNVAEKCIGIDINKEALEYLKQNLNYKDVFCADISEGSFLLNNELTWDYLVLGEILEHVDNPIAFLKDIHKKSGGKIKQIIITVPNAFAYYNFKSVKKHVEVINTDHRFWFTPYTLAKVLTNSGYKIDNFYFAQEISKKTGIRAKLKVLPFIKRKIIYRKLSKNPGFRDTLIMVASF